ncbi:MAG: MFS transporter [Bacteroidales bacterium]|nr:MFS transporter [Bacteroidales bacterium]
MKIQKKNIFKHDKVITISFAHFIHDIYSSFLAPLLPLLIDKLSITYGMVGILSFAQRFPSLFNPVIGIMADRVHLRILLVISPAITTVVMSLLGIAPSYSVLIVLLFVMGISSSLFHVPTPVMIKKVSGNQIGKGMSFYMIGGELARTLGPLFIVGGVSLWGLEGSWKVMPVGLVASVIIYFKIRKIQSTDEIQRKKSGVWVILAQFKTFFILLSGYIFFRAFMRQALAVLLPTYLINVRGFSFETGGIAFTLFQFAGILGAYFAGKYSDTIGRKVILLAISICSPILMFLFIFLDTTFSLPIIFVLGFFVIAQGPVLLALVNDVDSERPAFFNGVFMTISFLIGAVAMLIVGFVSDFIGLEKTLILTAVLALLAIPFIFWIPAAKALSIKH